MTTIQTRLCPLCTSGNQGILKKIRREEAEYDIVSCNHCDFIYVCNPNEVTYGHSKPDVLGNIEPPKHRHHQICRIIEKHSLEKERVNVLEIGAGYGHIGKLLRREGKYHYTGIEPNAGRAAYCSQQGLNVVESTFNESYMIGRDATADVVILDNVLEHVLDPKQTLQLCARALRQGGIIVVLVPNASDVRRFIPKWRKRHYWQPHCHINYFTHRDLGRLAGMCNLQLLNFPLNAMSINSRQDINFFAKVLLDNVGLRMLGLYQVCVKLS